MAENKWGFTGVSYHPTQKGAPYITPGTQVVTGPPPWWVRVDCRGLIVSRSRDSGCFWNFPLIQIDPHAFMRVFFPHPGPPRFDDLGGDWTPSEQKDQTRVHLRSYDWMSGMFWLFDLKIQFCSTVWPVAGCFLMDMSVTFPVSPLKISWKWLT